MADKSNGNFVAKTPVRLDGEDYAPGDLIQLSKKQAADMGESVEPRKNAPDAGEKK